MASLAFIVVIGTAVFVVATADTVFLRFFPFRFLASVHFAQCPAA